MAEPTSPNASLAKLSKMNRRLFDAHLVAMRDFEHELEEDGFSAYIVREMVTYLNEVPKDVEECLYDALKITTLLKMYDYYLSTLHRMPTRNVDVYPKDSFLPLFKVAKSMHNRGYAYEGKLVAVN